jgi:hypothetical protein
VIVRYSYGSHAYVHGFLLIETIVYSFMLILLSLLSMSCATHVYMSTHQTLKRAHHYAQLSATLDTLMAALAQAPCHKAGWKMVTPRQQIWSTMNGDIGFENTDHGIVRSQGQFDSKKNRWLKRTSSLLPYKSTYTLELINEDTPCIYLIKLSIIGFDQQFITTTIALRSAGWL